MTNSTRSPHPDDCLGETTLDKAMQEILGKRNPYAYTVFTFIQRLLYQYHLHARMEPYDVLHEAYQRGVRYQQTGQTIHNPMAWLKYTSLNIVREHGRSNRGVLTDPKILSEMISAGNQPMEQLLWLEELQGLRETVAAFAKEEPEAFKLLCMRTLDKLSWREIADDLSQGDRHPVSDVALRQQLSRAKRKFRELFHRLEQLTD
jgi:DNA-directed RNA polymerase specialized sigma24 family protein